MKLTIMSMYITELLNKSMKTDKIFACDANFLQF